MGILENIKDYRTRYSNWLFRYNESSFKSVEPLRVSELNVKVLQDNEKVLDAAFKKMAGDSAAAMATITDIKSLLRLVNEAEEIYSILAAYQQRFHNLLVDREKLRKGELTNHDKAEVELKKILTELQSQKGEIDKKIDRLNEIITFIEKLCEHIRNNEISQAGHVVNMENWVKDARPFLAQVHRHHQHIGKLRPDIFY